MLDPWIIEEILRRENEEQRQEQDKARIEIPLESPPFYQERDSSSPSGVQESDSDRGVVVIDI